MNNKTLKPAAILFLCSMALAAETHAEGVYDGIYTTAPFVGFVYFREQQGAMLAVLNQTEDDFIWGAGSGALNGTSVRLTTIIGSPHLVYDVNFTSPTSFDATLISCQPVYIDDCTYPNGATFTGTKIW